MNKKNKYLIKPFQCERLFLLLFFNIYKNKLKKSKEKFAGMKKRCKFASTLKTKQMKNKLKLNKETKEFLNSISNFIKAMGIVVIVASFKASISALVLSMPLKWLWNEILHLTKFSDFNLLSFWTAFKILFLSSLLFNIILRKRAKNNE